MRRELGMLVAVILLVVIIFLSDHAFLNAGSISDLLRQIAMLGIFAIGTSFVIISGGIDLSIGATIGLTGVLLARVSAPPRYPPGSGITVVHHLSFHQPIAVGIIVALTVAGLIGLAQGLLITKLKLQPFIVTLGGMLLIRGLAQVITHGRTISFGNSPFVNFQHNGLLVINHSPILSYPVLLCLGTAVLATYLLHFTPFGRYVFAIGGNRDAAEYSGIAVARIETTTYIISSLGAGVAGICFASYISQMTYAVGTSYELYAIAAAVIGGVSLRGGEGTVLGALIGSAMLRVISNGIIAFQIKYHNAAGHRVVWRLSSNWKYFVIGAVILLAVTFDQFAHIAQERRKLRQGAAAGPPSNQTGGSPPSIPGKQQVAEDQASPSVAAP